MQPQLFSFPLPKWFLEKFGPLSAMFSIWHLFAGIFIIALLVFLSQATYETEEEANEKANPRILWGSLVFLLPTGAILGSFGLARLGKFSINSYGMMISLAFVAGVILAMREAQRLGEGTDRIVDISFWLIVGGLAGSRILNTIIEWEAYLAHWKKVQHWYQWKLFKVWEGGLVFYGGLICATLAMVVYTHRKRIDFWKYADILVPSVALGQFFGRIGCFAAGCCYGKHTTVAWAVKFPQGAPYPNHLVHPTQLYEATASLLIFLFLLWYRRKKQFHGQVVTAYFMLYASVRFVVEIFRGDKIRGFLFQVDFFKSIPDAEILSTSQVVALLFIGVGFALFRYLKTREPVRNE